MSITWPNAPHINLPSRLKNILRLCGSDVQLQNQIRVSDTALKPERPSTYIHSSSEHARTCKLHTEWP